MDLDFDCMQDSDGEDKNKKGDLKRPKKKPDQRRQLVRKTISKDKHRKKKDNIIQQPSFSSSLTPVRVGHDYCGLQAPFQALEQARIPHKHVFSSDTDKWVRYVVKRNFRPVTFYKDVRKRDSTTAPQVDLFIFGPPCQPWSSAGLQEGLKDSRGRLLFASLDYLAEKRPRCFIMEEVIKVRSNRKVFGDLTRRMEDAGYNVFHDCLDTYTQGLPQARGRLYMVGIAKEVGCSHFTFPKRLGKPLLLTKILKRKQKTDCEDPSKFTPTAARNWEIMLKEAGSHGHDPSKEQQTKTHLLKWVDMG